MVILQTERFTLVCGRSPVRKDGRHLAMMPHPERALFPCSVVTILLIVKTVMRLLRGWKFRDARK